MRYIGAARAQSLIAVSALTMMSVLSAMIVMPAAADASAPAGPGWSIQALAQPARFSSSSDEECERRGGAVCDTYALVVTNVGSQPTLPGAPVTISDTLPEPLRVRSITSKELKTQLGLECIKVPVQCSATDVPAGETIVVEIQVIVPKGTSAGSVKNSASVAGGGAPAAATTNGVEIAPEPPAGSSPPEAGFGIEDFTLRAFDSNGLASTQADGHPYTVATSLYFKSDADLHPPEETKDVIVDLPPGLVGNPQTVPKCPLYALLQDSGTTGCLPASRVGTVVFEATPGTFRTTEEAAGETTALYNMQPTPGFPAEFGFTYLGKPLFLYASPVRINGRLQLRITVPGVPDGLEVVGSTFLFFSNPGEHFGEAGSSTPFFTNPSSCTDTPLSARVEIDSWQHPGVYDAAETTVYPELTGCNLLQFEPSLSVQPETTQADEPSGYAFTISNPQVESAFTTGTPDLRDATVTLPAGVSLSPGAADGLKACPATGPEGINIGSDETGQTGADLGDEQATELGAGHEGGNDSPYDDGLYHTAPGHCPAASTIGTVEIATPLLPSPLEGHVYVAQPECGGTGQEPCKESDASDGRLFKIYLEASGSGSIIKLAGSAFVNPTTGQITTSFTENPQVPFNLLRLHFNNGFRAPLANPQACGPATTSADFTPWSAPATPDSEAFPSFTVDWNGAGEACPGTLPLAPSLIAETANPQAGAYSPFNLTLARGDRQQYLSQLSVTMPSGLLAMISNVQPCGEPQAGNGTCTAASEIGTTTVSAGAGSHPYWVTGHVYLTSSYNGAPYGLSIVVPAQAGPFNLGNVVVRSAITVNPETSAVTITSGPLPQIIDGIPLRMQTVNVNVNRPNFTFNPTNCAAKQIVVTVAGAQGAQDQLSSPFAAANCKDLPFSPSFTASTRAQTSLKNGASLDVKVAFKPGQANTKSVAVTLPKQLPARLTTIQQACLAATFEANPATCPAGSLIGVVTATTPVLPGQLTGPAYLVSHGGAAFPDVVIILQGDGVRANLVGNINIAPKTELTSSTFASIPDVPVSSFELNLPEGSHSGLAINLPGKDKGDLCGITLTMPTVITGQNGDVINQTTKVGVTGCPKVKVKKKKKAKRRDIVVTGHKRKVRGR
jgi:hypothetical protein